jgi:ribosomal protein S18 acetylase RimI-like enzyme
MIGEPRLQWQSEVLNSLNAKDAGDLFILFPAVTHTIKDEAYLKENLSKIITNDSSALIVIRDNGQIIACAITNLRFKAGRIEALIDDVVVSERMRGQGVGKAIFRAAMQWSRQHGASLIELTSRPSRENANTLWQSLGFDLRDTNVYRLKL